jgi:hypothetical protein
MFANRLRRVVSFFNLKPGKASNKEETHKQSGDAAVDPSLARGAAVLPHQSKPAQAGKHQGRCSNEAEPFPASERRNDAAGAALALPPRNTRSFGFLAWRSGVQATNALRREDQPNERWGNSIETARRLLKENFMAALLEEEVLASGAVRNVKSKFVKTQFNKVQSWDKLGQRFLNEYASEEKTALRAKQSALEGKISRLEDALKASGSDQPVKKELHDFRIELEQAKAELDKVKRHPLLVLHEAHARKAEEVRKAAVDKKLDDDEILVAAYILLHAPFLHERSDERIAELLGKQELVKMALRMTGESVVIDHLATKKEKYLQPDVARRDAKQCLINLRSKKTVEETAAILLNQENLKKKAPLESRLREIDAERNALLQQPGKLPDDLDNRLKQYKTEEDRLMASEAYWVSDTMEIAHRRVAQHFLSGNPGMTEEEALIAGYLVLHTICLGESDKKIAEKLNGIAEELN